jgi:IMP dehydrogenase
VPVCADGGLRFSGDITIALGAGASSVMMGSMLAGTDEAPGEVVFKDGRSWKEYRGMGSLSAMEASRSSRERYSQKDTGKTEIIPEGIEGRVPYKGKVSLVITQYVGGLKRGMGYVGAATINNLKEKADFIRLSAAGQAESHPHDVEITREAPNYSVRK